MKHTRTLRRFGSHEIDTANAVGLRADHAAVVDGRTLFPSTVVGSMASPRFLVSGHNNPKLGKEVLKGERKGWPIFHLTLEERATCPRSCEQWLTCFGNAMPQARRHAVDDLFLPLLRAEVATLARANPRGLLIRLHALGDFYSAEYVLAWAELLAQFPQVAVFGYTARRTDDPDPASAKIAQVIQIMTDAMWDRFAIRTSASDPITRSRATVVLADPEEPDIIVCPAQTGATEACATCGLCWAENARDKTIAFLVHGMTRQRGPRAAPEPVKPVAVVAPSASAGEAIVPQPPVESVAGPALETYVPLPVRIAKQIEDAAPGLLAKYPDGVLIAPILKATGATYNQAIIALGQLHKDGKIAWVRATPTEKYKVMRPAGAIEPAAALTESQAAVLGAISKAAVNGLVEIDRHALKTTLGIPLGIIDAAVTRLRSKGFIEWVGAGESAAVYRLVRAAPAITAPPKAKAPLPKAAPTLPAVLKAPGRPKESILWERAEPVAKTRQARAIPATDCPAVPAIAPPRPDQALVIPVDLDDADLPAWWPPGSLLALKYGDCRWPTNTPPVGRGEEMKFCCAPVVEGESYCPAHAAKAHGRQVRA